MYDLLMASAATAALLALGTGGPVGAQDGELDPIGFGGRVEVAEVGYALTFPEDWVYVYPSATDVSEVMDLASEAVPALATTIEAALQQGLGLSLMAFGDVDQDRGFAENCNVLDAPAGGVPLSLAVAAETAAYARLGDQLASGPDVTMLELPAGEAARIDYGLRFPGYETLHAAYFFSDGSVFFVLTCTDLERPDDDWLSIAETFEFLP